MSANGTTTSPSKSAHSLRSIQLSFLTNFLQKERREWVARLHGVCLASESAFPGRECLDLAKQFGAKFVVTPSGGPADEDVYEACEQHSMVLVHTTQAQTLR